MQRILRTGIGFVMVFVALAGSALSMPAFARKYSMTCKTCHTPFPKLKPYGETFAANGFVIKDKETPRYYIDTGDGWLSLLRDVPIALRLEGFLSYNNSGSRRVEFLGPDLV
jgi:hypothetical protein